MKRFYIKKCILAKSIHDALRKANNADIVEIYQDMSYIHDLNKKIGFTDKKPQA